jgi:ABC-type cobalamin/Fe3+-siderophores transport system ATPase subunit
MTDAALSFRHVRFGYQRTRPVLHDVSFALLPGRVAAILGPNGAGKTTLLALALGWHQPWEGEIWLADHPVPQLSGGERQLMLLARAIAQAPRLLLLDEPTAHLDLHNKSRLIQIMRRLRSRGVTMLMTSHEPDVVLAVADDVLLMEPGHPPQFGPLDEIFTAEALSRIPDLPLQLATVDGRRHVLWT